MKRSQIAHGATFHFWVVIDGPYISRGNNHPRTTYKCRCRCGTERVIRSDTLLRAQSLSCGCHDGYHPDRTREYHGLTETPEYEAWCSMRARCEQPNHAAFSYYGGRGIRMCEAWRASFRVFLKDVGPRPSPLHSIDRIDNDGHYEPDNVRWATDGEQMRNRRNVKRYTHAGLTLTVREWSERTGICAVTLHQRIWRRKWSVERAVTERPHH